MRKKKNYDELDYTVVLTEEPRHTIREFLFKSIRKLRCAGRMLKEIVAQVATRNTEAPPHKNIQHDSYSVRVRGLFTSYP